MVVRNPITGFTDVLPQQGLGPSNLKSPTTPQVTNQQIENFRRRNAQAQQQRPSGFLGGLQRVGSVLSPIFSGEDFINTVTRSDVGTDIRNKLEDVPTVGGFLGAVFDVGTSPLTALTGGFGPTIGRLAGGLAGASRAGRLAAGTTKALTAPLIQSGNPLQRIGAETAVLAGAETAQRELGLPGWTQLAAIPVGIGALRGAQKTGVGKTLFGTPGSGQAATARRILADITEGAGPGKEAEKISTIAGKIADKRNEGSRRFMTATADDADDAVNIYDADIDDLNLTSTMGDIWRGARGLIDQLGVQARNFQSYISANADDAGKIIAKYAKGKDKVGNRTFPHVLDENGDEALVGDVIEYLGSKGYTKSRIDRTAPGLYDALNRLRGLSQEIRAERIAHGIDIPKGLEADIDKVGGQIFFPRYAKSKDVKDYIDKGIKSDREFIYMNQAYDRKYKTFIKGARSVEGSPQLYEDPANAIAHYARDTATDIKNYEVAKSLEKFIGEPTFDDVTGALLWGEKSPLSGTARAAILKSVDDMIVADATFKNAKTGEIVREWDKLTNAQKAEFEERYEAWAPIARLGDESTPFDAKTAKVLNEYFSDPKSKIANLEFMRKINQEIVPLRSTLDISGGFVTNAAVFFSDPIGFLANMGRALGDVKDAGRIKEFFDSTEVLGGTKNGKEYVGAGKFVTLISPNDPTAHREYIYGGSKSSQNKVQKAMGRLTAPFNRNFAMIGNRNRTALFYDMKELYEKALRDAAEETGAIVDDAAELLDDAALREIGRAVDRVTGIATNQAGDLERAILFAPNFYRSMFETVGNLVENGSIEGDLARKYISNMVAAGTGLVTTAAIIQGRDPTEVLALFDGEALKDGDLRLNPNFGTIRIGGRDVNVWGPYDSMARLAIGAGNMGLQLPEEKIAAVQDYLTYAARTKGGPVVSSLTNLWLGETFTGRDFFSVEGLATQTLPFSLSTGIEEGADAAAIKGSAMDGLIAGMLGSGLSASGMKENPVTPYEELDRAARRKKEFGHVPYAELTAQEKDIINKENPLVVRRLEANIERRGTPEGKMSAWRVQDREKLIEEQGQAFNQLQTTGDRFKFRKTMDALAERHSITARAKEEELGVEYDPPNEGSPESVIPSYYKILDTARDPLSGELNWDLVDSELAKLESDIKSGFYGDPRRAQEFLDERLVFKGNPNVKWYFDNKSIIRETLMDEYNYWDQKDRAFDELQSVVSSAAGRNVSTYNGLVEEINAATIQNNIRKASRLKIILNRIDRKSDLYRKRMRKKNPGLEKALRENGYLS